MPLVGFHRYGVIPLLFVPHRATCLCYMDQFEQGTANI